MSSIILNNSEDLIGVEASSISAYFDSIVIKEKSNNLVHLLGINGEDCLDSFNTGIYALRYNEEKKSKIKIVFDCGRFGFHMFPGIQEITVHDFGGFSEWSISEESFSIENNRLSDFNNSIVITKTVTSSSIFNRILEGKYVLLLHGNYIIAIIIKDLIECQSEVLGEL